VSTLPKRTTAPRTSQRSAPRDQSARRRIRRRPLDDISDQQLVRRAQQAPALLRPAELLRLQSVAGNRAVTDHISRLVDTGLAQRQPSIQRDDVLIGDEQQKQAQDGNQTGGNTGEQVQNTPPDPEPEIEPALAQGAHHLRLAVKGLSEIAVEGSDIKKAPTTMNGLLSFREYEPVARAWEGLVEATRRIIQQETSKGIKKGPKSLMQSFSSRDRAKKRSESAGKSYGRWLNVADALRGKKVLAPMFRGIVNSRLKATDKNFKTAAEKQQEKTHFSQDEYARYNNTIVEELENSQPGQLYQRNAREIGNILKSAKESVEDTDNLQIVFKELAGIRVDPRVEARHQQD